MAFQMDRKSLKNSGQDWMKSPGAIPNINDFYRANALPQGFNFSQPNPITGETSAQVIPPDPSTTLPQSPPLGSPDIPYLPSYPPPRTGLPAPNIVRPNPNVTTSSKYRLSGIQF